MALHILEHIIKSILLEDRIVAKTGDRISKSEYNKAKAAGAVHAFTVLVKGTSDITKILDMAVKAISKSQSDSEMKISVGEESKFADGTYIYLISNPVSKNRQNLVVWIIKNPGVSSKTSADKKDSDVKISTSDTTDIDTSKTKTEPEIKVSRLKYRYIGESPLLTKKQLDSAKLKTTIDTSALQTMTDDVEKYPINWRDKDGVTWGVYTTSYSDKMVYIKSGESWFSVSKDKFEREMDNLVAGDLFNDRVTDEDLLTKLNKQKPESSYPRFSTSDQQPVSTTDGSDIDSKQTTSEPSTKSTDTVSPTDNKATSTTTSVSTKTEPVTTTPVITKPVVPSIKPGTVLQFKDSANTEIPLYWFKDGKYSQAKNEKGELKVWIIDSSWKTNKNEQLTYIKSSSDKQWYLVKTPTGKQYWIKSSRFKK
jgi:hypothetical protein